MCRKAAGSFSCSVYFPTKEIRTPEVDQQYKFKEELRNKLWIDYRKSIHLAVIRHIQSQKKQKLPIPVIYHLPGLTKKSDIF